jgi:predicted aconitase
LEEAFGARPPVERIAVSRREIVFTMEQMSKGDSGAVDVVGVGCPHASIDQMRRYATLLQGKRIHSGTELWICANTVVEDRPEKWATLKRSSRPGRN